MEEIISLPGYFFDIYIDGFKNRLYGTQSKKVTLLNYLTLICLIWNVLLNIIGFL